MRRKTIYIENTGLIHTRAISWMLEADIGSLKPDAQNEAAKTWWMATCLGFLTGEEMVELARGQTTLEFDDGGVTVTFPVPNEEPDMPSDKEIDALTERLSALGDDVLDECLHDIYSSHAAEVNNGGTEHQIRHLIDECGWTLSQISDEVGELNGGER